MDFKRWRNGSASAERLCYSGVRAGADLLEHKARREANKVVRQAFYSFHYVPDSWRAGQVRNMGVIEGNKPASDHDWESITTKGDAAIKRWIDDQIYGRSVVIVLIGARTAGRKWINYEIRKAWEDGKGLMGIYIHNLRDRDGNQTVQGVNPFDAFSVGGKRMSSIVKAYTPPHSTSVIVYQHIKDNLSGWIEEAIAIRQRHP